MLSRAIVLGGFLYGINYLKAKKAQDIIRYKGKTGTVEAFNILLNFKSIYYL